MGSIVKGSLEVYTSVLQTFKSQHHHHHNHRYHNHHYHNHNYHNHHHHNHLSGSETEVRVCWGESGMISEWLKMKVRWSESGSRCEWDDLKVSWDESELRPWRVALRVKWEWAEMSSTFSFKGKSLSFQFLKILKEVSHKSFAFTHWGNSCTKALVSQVEAGQARQGCGNEILRLPVVFGSFHVSF